MTRVTAVDNVTSEETAAAAPAPADSSSTRESRPIKAVGRPHPWRWAGAIVVLGVVGLFGYGAATNDAYQWDVYWKYLFDERISRGALVSLELVGIATAAGLIVGVGLALMRVSANPVLKAIAWVYMWFFRGIPLFVQLLFWGLIATIYQRIDIGVPFSAQVAHVDVRDVTTAFALAAIGLSLYAAAALAETTRGALLSVERAQGDAAAALGMTAAQSMRRVVLPQALRAMLPATGNEVITLLKATSLVVAIPLATDLLGSTSQIGRRIDSPVPLLLVAATWYLGMVSILMIGQAALERRFGRGAAATAARRDRRVKARAAAQAESRAAKSAKEQARSDEKAAAAQQKEAQRLAAQQEKAAKQQAKADAKQAKSAPPVAEQTVAEQPPAEQPVADDPAGSPTAQSTAESTADSTTAESSGESTQKPTEEAQ